MFCDASEYVIPLSYCKALAISAWRYFGVSAISLDVIYAHELLELAIALQFHISDVLYLMTKLHVW